MNKKEDYEMTLLAREKVEEAAAAIANAVKDHKTPSPWTKKMIDRGIAVNEKLLNYLKRKETIMKEEENYRKVLNKTIIEMKSDITPPWFYVVKTVLWIVGLAVLTYFLYNNQQGINEVLNFVRRLES